MKFPPHNKLKDDKNKKIVGEIADYVDKTRKETAEKILIELLDFVNGWFESTENNDFIVEFNRVSKDFAEKYGVDVR